MPSKNPDRRSIPTQQDIVQYLWPCFVASEDPGLRKLARRLLRLIDKNLVVGLRSYRKPVAEVSKRRKRRYKYDVAARIEQIKAKYGQPDTPVEQRKPAGPPPERKASAKPAFPTTDIPRQHQEPIQPAVAQFKPAVAHGKLPPLEPGVDRRVFRFESGNVYEGAKTGGAQIDVRQVGRCFYDRMGKKITVIDVLQRPQHKSWEPPYTFDDDSRSWIQPKPTMPNAPARMVEPPPTQYQHLNPAQVVPSTNRTPAQARPAGACPDWNGRPGQHCNSPRCTGWCGA